MADPYQFNTRNQTAYPTTKTDFYNKVNQLGGVANLMREYPQLYNPTYRWWNDAVYGAPSQVRGVMESWDMPYSGIDPVSRLQAKISDLNEIAGMFPGPEATYIRWLIANQQKKLQAQIDYERSQIGARASAKLGQIKAAEKVAMKTGVPVDITGVYGNTITGMMPFNPEGQPVNLGQTPSGEDIWELQPSEYSEKIGTTKEYLENVSGTSEVEEAPSIAPPVPDWMKPYLEPAIQYEATEYGEGTAPSVRPIGAQAQLSPTQLGELAGYEAWGRAGAPTEYSEGALQSMADWEKWWTPLLNLSKALFPSQQKLKARWMPAKQGG